MFASIMPLSLVLARVAIMAPQQPVKDHNILPPMANVIYAIPLWPGCPPILTMILSRVLALHATTAPQRQASQAIISSLICNVTNATAPRAGLVCAILTHQRHTQVIMGHALIALTAIRAIASKLYGSLVPTNRIALLATQMTLKLALTRNMKTPARNIRFQS